MVTADTDFGMLLVDRSARTPSVIQFRGEGSRTPEVLARVILTNLPQLTEALESGAIATLNQLAFGYGCFQSVTDQDD